jgi:1L-myo-inositol 1-phosphate cytidylyltransferase / CDP-L-myo-inositol myo-inositolphosphotransferase
MLAKTPAIVQETAVRHECIILGDGPGALAGLCGISLLERLLRQLQRLGLRKAIVLSATPDHLAEHLANPSPHRAKVAVDIRSRTAGPVNMQQLAEAWPNDAEHVLIFRADTVFDSRLLQLLDEQDSTTALVDSSPPAKLEALVAGVPTTSRGRLCGGALLAVDWTQRHCGGFAEALRGDIEASRIRALDIASRSWRLPSLRRELRPYWFPVPEPAQQQIAERVLLEASQKRSIDFPAMVHAPIENFLISHLWKTAITPNQLTVATNIVAWGATFLFATGHLASGTMLALIVGVLDGLDGKQARVKVETSSAGKLEHWFDALFENSWWIALAYYLQSSGKLPGAFAYLALLIGAEAVAGLAKWSVLRFCGRTIDEIGDFNRVVRLVGGRRNIYVWIFALGILFGIPDQTFKLMAYWAAVTTAVQVPRAALAVRGHRK